MDKLIESTYFAFLDTKYILALFLIIFFLLNEIYKSFFLKRKEKKYVANKNKKTTNIIQNEYDVIIVGAGTAGCTLALQLSSLADKRNKNINILIIDKESEMKERIVGELMQPKGIEILKKMNILDCVTDKNVDAVPSIGYEIHMPEKNGEDKSKTVLCYPEKTPQNLLEYFGYMKLQNIHDLYDEENKEKNVLTEETAQKIRKISYNNNNYSVDTPLVAFGFHNYRFVNNLRKKIKERQNIKFIEGNVINLIEEEDNEDENKIMKNVKDKVKSITGVEYISNREEENTLIEDNNNREEKNIKIEESNSTNNNNRRNIKRVYSKLVCLCDGGVSMKLRKIYNKEIIQRKLSTWIGVLIKHNKWNSPLNTAGICYVILCSPSPVLMYQISSIETRCLICVDTPVHVEDEEDENKSYYNYLYNIILPQLPSESIKTAFLKSINTNKFSIRNVYSMNADLTKCKRLIAVGDSFNMRHAITGCGMTVALNDVMILSELIMNEDLSDPFASFRISSDLCKKRRNIAGTLNTLANALHDVFTTPEGSKERIYIQRACYNYLSSGSVYTAGPIGLLSGLTGNPLVLTFHFFFVVFFAMKTVLFSYSEKNYFFSFFKRIPLLYSVFHEGVKIFLPFVINEDITFLSKWPSRSLINIIFPYKKLNA